jgi:hypothetical protein
VERGMASFTERKVPRQLAVTFPFASMEAF